MYSYYTRSLSRVMSLNNIFIISLATGCNKQGNQVVKVRVSSLIGCNVLWNRLACRSGQLKSLLICEHSWPDGC